MPYAAPIFSSGNPTVDSLFGREFGVYQGDQAARMEAAKNEILRQQVMAQARLAEAQQQSANQQQQYNNLFRMAEFKDRQAGGDEQRKLFERQLNIDETYKKGLIQKPVVRSAQDIEEANAASDAIASQLNANYQTKLAAARADVEKKRKSELDSAATLGLFPATAGKLKDITDKYDQQLKALEDSILGQVQDVGTRYFPPGSFGVDPLSRKFVPVRIGKSATAPGASGTPALSPPSGSGPLPGAPEAPGTGSGEGASAPPVPFVMPSATASAGSASTAFGNPFTGLSGLFGARSGQAPVTPALIHVPVPGGTLEISQQDADELERQIRLVPDEQRAATFRAMQDQLLKSSRARIIAAPAAVPAFVPAPTFMPSQYQ